MAENTRQRIILVTGATGKQGGAVARHLVGKGFHIRVMTRKPESEAARALAALNMEVVRGDLDDPSSLDAPLTGAWGAFAVQNTWEAGVEREEAEGHAFARKARERGVQHFVYSSVGSAHRQTGIPHFENKWRVEGTVRSLGFPSHFIMRPVFFMENLISPWFLHGDKLISGMKPDTPLQMVAVEDIGALGALGFLRAGEMNGREVDLAGDSVSLGQAAATFGRAWGRKIEYQQIPMDEIRKNGEDFALMLEWFERVGYNADIEGVARTYDLRLTRLEDWARSHRPE